MANSSKLWLYWSGPRCEQGAGDKEQMCSVKKITVVLEVCKQCLRTDCPVNMLQMQVSLSVGLRGTRRWNKPGDLRSLSQNAMRMEHLPRSVSVLPLISFPTDFLLFSFLLLTLPLSFSLLWTIPPSHSPGDQFQFTEASLIIPFIVCCLYIQIYKPNHTRITKLIVLVWLTISSLQVQCHTLTGYCWCVTSDGKPVSGSSVHNRTPVCSGTRRQIPWQPVEGIIRIFKITLKCLSYIQTHTVDASNKSYIYCWTVQISD